MAEPGVLGVQRAQQLVARHPHILVTLAGFRRFIAITVATRWTRVGQDLSLILVAVSADRTPNRAEQPLISAHQPTAKGAAQTV